jgi:hypothetical protein
VTPTTDSSVLSRRPLSSGHFRDYEPNVGYIQDISLAIGSYRWSVGSFRDEFSRLGYEESGSSRCPSTTRKKFLTIFREATTRTGAMSINGPAQQYHGVSGLDHTGGPVKN